MVLSIQVYVNDVALVYTRRFIRDGVMSELKS